MFLASRKEWVELVALMKVMSKDKLHWSNNQGLPIKGRTARLECIQRKEQNGFRTYRRIVVPGEGETPDATVIEITNADTKETLTVEAELWSDAADHAVDILRNNENDATVPVDDAMEAFLDEIQMVSLGGISEGPWHILLGINGQKTAVTGVLSRCGAVPSRLLDGGRAANLKLLQTGTRFAQPMAQKVNYVGEDTPDAPIAQIIRERMDMIERMGSSLKYDDVADKVFRCNLAMMDLHMGRLLTEIVRTSYLEDNTHLDELTLRMNEINPLKVKQDLIDKHHYYEYKVRQLLLACVGGMRPAKIYTGSDNLPAFFIVVTPDGTPVLFDATDRDLLGRFLLLNSRLERGHMGKDHYGLLERENNAYYFKLNLKIGLTKR